jgi:hypothetical protein
MIVPAHWSEATVAGTVDARRVKVKRFGWSDVDEATAERMATARATEALARLQRGEPVSRREPKVPYNGAEGVPIREEIVRRIGDTVITRNSYGALCLNTPDVLFIDVDFEPSIPVRVTCLVVTISGAALAALGFWQGGPMGAVAGALVGLLLGPVVAAWSLRTWIGMQGGPVRVAERRIERLATKQPNGRFLVYRTPAGLRVLVAHDTFEPASAATLALFRALGADPTYVAMCTRQRCFRARLTAKPWRIGITDHLRPRPGVWPVHPERRPLRQRWLGEYDRKAASYAACHFERSLGLGPEHPRVAPVRALHDELSRARTELPIA